MVHGCLHTARPCFFLCVGQSAWGLGAWNKFGLCLSSPTEQAVCHYYAPLDQQWWGYWFPINVMPAAFTIHVFCISPPEWDTLWSSRFWEHASSVIHVFWSAWSRLQQVHKTFSNRFGILQKANVGPITTDKCKCQLHDWSRSAHINKNSSHFTLCTSCPWATLCMCCFIWISMLCAIWQLEALCIDLTLPMQE